MKIKKEDIKKRNPFWKESRFKRIHKNKKKYNRKNFKPVADDHNKE